MSAKGKNFRIMFAIVILIMMAPTLSNATIKFRDTFEHGTWSSWTIDVGGNGECDRYSEDESNEYASQSHGDRSYWFKDPNDSSYANACTTFTNSSSEYMIEFYLWIYHTHETIDSFPLCVLWNMPGEGLPEKTDVSLFLHESGDSFLVYLEDSAGIQQDVATIGSTDRWYKIQIYRYVSGSDTVVTFYLDGDSIDTYVPMNKDKVSNKISLGTTSADSLADGEVFYDDFIIIDYSDRKNKITAIKDTNQKDMLSFLSEANDYFSRINPYLIHKNYHYFRPEDVYYVVSLSNLSNATLEDLSNYERLSYFNELIVRLDQIKLGLLYGNLNETEKDLIRRTFDFCIVDIKDNDAYNMITKKEWK